MEVGFKTDTGLRRNNNEDAYSVKIEDKVFIVADGVGGNNSGEVASRTAIDEILKYMDEHPLKEAETDDQIEEYFQECIKKVNLRVLELSRFSDENQGMATTLVLVYIDNGRAHIVNIGDSRAYILHNSRFVQITDDHTYVNSLVKAGLISYEEAEHHEQKNMITRAIGAAYDIEPDFFKVPIKEGDIILLCSDGLYSEVNSKAIAKELEKDKPVLEICETLVQKANEQGGHDNITLVVVKIMEEDIK